MKILGVESSADESSLAIVEDGKRVLRVETASQINKHKPYGGIVPELAARRHLDNLPVMFDKLFSKEEIADIDAIAITTEPGLPPALRTGIAFAEGLSYALNKPLIPVNHVHAHAYAPFIDPQYADEEIKFPLLALVVSGGHTQLMLFKHDMLDFELLGATIDDAAGEAFDKVARLLDLPYPGGPQIEEQSKKGDEFAHAFPRPMLDSNDYRFSFSGLKTAVRYHWEKAQADHKKTEHAKEVMDKVLEFAVADVAASFQQAVIDVLVGKTIKAAEEYKVQGVILGGGVAANKRLQNALALELHSRNIPFYYPVMTYCLDNAAMIAGLGFHLSHK